MLFILNLSILEDFDCWTRVEETDELLEDMDDALTEIIDTPTDSAAAALEEESNDFTIATEPGALSANTKRWNFHVLLYLLFYWFLISWQQLLIRRENVLEK